jgi:GNAT superfamily N-acetyltransferase
MIPRPSDFDPNHAHITIENIREEHIPSLAAMQKIVFPTLADDELFSEAKYRNHLRLFPEGQFVALLHHNGQQIPVGATSTFRTNFDFSDIQHTFSEALADGWLTNHDPNGEWLYGADMSVHPEYRGLRLARRLYDARRALVRRLNMRGELAGALIPGYVHHHHKLTVAQYILHVWQEKLHDPTLSVQLRNGFRPKGVLYEHISDARSANAATLIVRENPDYKPPAPVETPSTMVTQTVPAVQAGTNASRKHAAAQHRRAKPASVAAKRVRTQIAHL